MCGIALVIRRGLAKGAVTATLEKMATLQAHRGPDHHGIWVEELPDLDVTIGLGHQRLAIIDLSAAGNQPMFSAQQKSAIIFNGEIYNYRDLAPDFSSLLSSGDTATLLALLDSEAESGVSRLNGMWAFVHYDRESQNILISRDRFGMKPLHYYCDDQQLIMSSEVKPILEASGTRFKLNYESVGRYLFQSLLNSSDETFFEGISAVSAGTVTTINLSCFRPVAGFKLQGRKFWEHPAYRSAHQPIENPVFELRQAIKHSVERHLISDVPVGLFLSGGLDSSSILATALRVADQPPRCFSVVSASSSVSEEIHINRVSRFCGITPYIMNAEDSPQHFLDLLPEICRSNEQPVTSLTVAVHSELVQTAKAQGIKVLLTGQGVDEQMAGYNKFFYFHLMNQFKRGHLIECLSQFFGAVGNRTILSEFRLSEAKRYIPFVRDMVRDSYIGRNLESIRLFSVTGNPGLHQREATDLFHTSLPAILHYEDRMSMRHSCEMRVPYLDTEIVELLGALPERWHIQQGFSKFALRKAMRAWLPQGIAFRRDKKGFSLPETRWLKEVYMDTLRSTFSGDPLIYQWGIAERAGVLRLLDLFCKGRVGVGSKDVFNLYCMEIWLNQFSRYLAI